MKKWRVNELSKITQVSVRTLHHYDKINLLKPSLRASNRYRFYSETDLLKLQQIIALKFFGFKLSHIKTLLVDDVNISDHFSIQARLLKEKSQALQEASQILMRITSCCSDKKSIPWENIIQLIEVYHMTQQLENTWVSKILNPQELKQYIRFEQDLKIRYSAEEKAQFEKNWASLLIDIQKNIALSPTSETGIAIGERCIKMINEFYGKENFNLRSKIWHEGFKKNKQTEHGISPEMTDWLDKAISAYWRKRIYEVLSQIGKQSSAEVVVLWNNLLEEMHGDEQEAKALVLAAALSDDNVSQQAKTWLKEMF